MRWAVLIAVAGGERQIALEAVRSLRAAVAPDEVDVHVVDDATPDDAGGLLHAALGGDAGADPDAPDGSPTLAPIGRLTIDRLSSPLGYFGAPARTVRGLAHFARAAADPTDPRPYDGVIKIDPDALVVDADFGTLIREHCAGRTGMFGEVDLVKWTHRLQLQNDGLLVGLARSVGRNGIRKRPSVRPRPAPWWADAYRAARRRGYDYQFAKGGLYVVGGGTLTAMRDAGYLPDDFPTLRRHGLMAAEDVLVAVLTRAVDHPIVELADVRPNWCIMHAWPELNADTLREKQPIVVHPLKANPLGEALRGRVSDWLDESAVVPSNTPPRHTPPPTRPAATIGP